MFEQRDGLDTTYNNSNFNTENGTCDEILIVPNYSQYHFGRISATKQPISEDGNKILKQWFRLSFVGILFLNIECFMS